MLEKLYNVNHERNGIFYTIPDPIIDDIVPVAPVESVRTVLKKYTVRTYKQTIFECFFLNSNRADLGPVRPSEDGREFPETAKRRWNAK